MLPDRKGAQCVGYLSDGMDYGVHAAAADLGPTPRIPWTEEEVEETGLKSICLPVERCGLLFLTY